MDKVNFGDNRWKIIYGSYNGIEKSAVDMLYGAVSQHTEYILTATASKDVSLDELKEINPIFIGTRETQNILIP